MGIFGNGTEGENKALTEILEEKHVYLQDQINRLESQISDLQGRFDLMSESFSQLAGMLERMAVEMARHGMKVELPKLED